MIAATIRTIFAQRDPDATRNQLREVVGLFEVWYPRAAELVEDAQHDVTAYAGFPRAHGRKIASTNPLEQVH